jgi:hypothetical protein
MAFWQHRFVFLENIERCTQNQIGIHETLGMFFEIVPPFPQGIQQ